MYKISNESSINESNASINIDKTIKYQWKEIGVWWCRQYIYNGKYPNVAFYKKILLLAQLWHIVLLISYSRPAYNKITWNLLPNSYFLVRISKLFGKLLKAQQEI